MFQSQIPMIKETSIGETSIGSNSIVINLMITISFCKKKTFWNGITTICCLLVLCEQCFAFANTLKSFHFCLKHLWFIKQLVHDAQNLCSCFGFFTRCISWIVRFLFHWPWRSNSRNVFLINRHVCLSSYAIVYEVLFLAFL